MRVSQITPIIISGIFISIILHFAQGWLPLKSEVPMGHGLVELRVKKSQVSLKTSGVGSYRLPKSISPIHYDLEIRPILDSKDDKRYTAPGVVNIHIKCLQRTSSVTLHSKQLIIDYLQIKITNVSNSSSVNVSGFNRDDDRDFLIIFFDHDLTVDGEYKLTIPFTATIADPQERRSGIYLSRFGGSDGSIKEMAVTQFQKAYAREAFPCFDEPSSLFKATFSVKIGRKESYQSFSNMEKIGDPVQIDGLSGWVWDTYAKSIKMPVYILAFAVTCDYAVEVAPSHLYRLPVKTWVPKMKLTNTSVKYATEVSAKILKIFEELFDYPYTIGKMENLAINMDLWAMENIGLVTFRPGFLVWSPEETTQFEKWSAIALISHEYVHQYFGNLVTCEWWNDFWLNEGFARYFQFVGSQHADDSFRAIDRYVLDVTQWAMILDEGSNSVPVHGTEMERVTYSPFQIEYDKAGALIRMMATFLTQDTFFKGLQSYFKKHQFNNTVQDDLFQSMTEQAIADKTLTQYTVKEIMDSWTKLRGFPVIRVSRADNDTIYISQHRFLYHPYAQHDIEGGLWYVPIWYLTKSNKTFDANNTTPQFWMDNTTVITYLHVDTKEDDYIIVNPEGRGYYRVIYDHHFTNMLTQQLEKDHTEINFATRSQLIDDYFRSAQARYINIHYAMDITVYLPKEDDLIVWTTALNNLRALYTRLVDTSIIDLFKRYMMRLIIPPLKRIGEKPSENDTPSDVMLRAQLLDWACALESEICTNHAVELFKIWMLEPNGKIPIQTDYQPQLYCAAVASQQLKDIHEFLLNHYKRTKSARQKSLVVQALACDRSEVFLESLILSAVNKSEKIDINLKEHGRLLAESIAKNYIARNLAWNYLNDKHMDLTRVFGPMGVPRFISAMVPYASSASLSKLDTRITAFISNYVKTEKLTVHAEYSLHESARKIVENSYWMEYYFYELKDWLKDWLNVNHNHAVVPNGL